MKLTDLQRAFSKGSVDWRRHALEKMAEREILMNTVKQIIEKGQIIEDYPSSKPFPSALVLGLDGKRPIHVVAAFDESAGKAFIITAYEPNIQEFGPDFKTRRKKT